MHVIVEILVSVLLASPFCINFFPLIPFSANKLPIEINDESINCIVNPSFFSSFLQAKRDPYRFRFPIEMRFVHPNIDLLMYAILDLW